MLSPTGRSKTLDVAADGYVRGEASVAAIVSALDAGGPVPGGIYLLSAAVNQDGRTSTLTAPSGPAQSALLRAGLAEAGLAPADLAGLQLHGTGTSLGDGVEMGAVAEALRAGATAPLVLSAAKTSAGHRFEVGRLFGL